ncbi:hypothetical protein [Rubrivivax gelatinosus]|uniref:hypothetical protein n=1 Tax=Rubrivivax gelatinosus TaxID=28068 RepID=UPI001904EC3E|nr:hypothetical protein [Rubrivivax gelatinosus]
MPRSNRFGLFWCIRQAGMLVRCQQWQVSPLRRPGRNFDVAASDVLRSYRKGILTAALAFSGCATQCAEQRDLDGFIQRRAVCDHFRGELPDPADTARMNEIVKNANEFCAGTDAQLRALK